MKPPYTCFCCGYTTINRANMSQHLYKRKKPCPKILNNIEFTDEIKQHILNNRIYIPPAAPPAPKSVVINNTINNNTMMNIVLSIDPVEKIKRYVEYNDTELVGFDDCVSKIYEKKTCDFILDKPNIKFTHNNFLEMINEISNLSEGRLENLNILYDQKMNQIKLYDEGTATF